MPGAEDVQDEQHHPSTAFLRLGKRQGRGSLTAPGTLPAISSVSSPTLYQEGALSIFCRRLRRAFLVDSGADMSVFPASSSQKKKFLSASSLVAANGTSINTYGRKEIFLKFPGLKVLHSFLLADVRKPILETDFFRLHGLLIDNPGRRLLRTGDANSSPLTVVKARSARFVRSALFRGSSAHPG